MRYKRLSRMVLQCLYAPVDEGTARLYAYCESGEVLLRILWMV